MNKRNWEDLAKFLLTFIVGAGGTAIYFHISLNRELGEHKTKIETLEKALDELKQSHSKLGDEFNKLNIEVNGLGIRYGAIKPGEGITLKRVNTTSPTTTINLKELKKK